MAKKSKKQDRTIKLKLRFSHRHCFSELYPEQADILTGVLVRDIRQKVDLSQNQLKQWGLKPGTKPGTVVWDIAKDKVTTVAFTSAEMVFLKEQVAKMDKEKKIKDSFLDVAISIQSVVIGE